MLLEMTCASALCFAPELNLYKPSVLGKQIEIIWPTPKAAEHFVNVQDIVVSVERPVRYLAESEQRALDRALFQSIRIVHEGRLRR